MDMELNQDCPTCPYCSAKYDEWFREFNFEKKLTQIIKCYRCEKEYECSITHKITFDSFEK